MHTTRTNKLVDLPSLLALRQAYRQAQRTVVWTNGCFDLLHAGHVRSLQAASCLGDVLVVGLNSDESVRQLKGDGRPLFPVLARAEVLAALECVDHVLVFADRTPTAVLARLRPDVHCKGADYAPPHGQPVPERAVVEAHGGRVAFLPLSPGLSTTDLLRRLARLASPPDPEPGQSLRCFPQPEVSAMNSTPPDPDPTDRHEPSPPEPAPDHPLRLDVPAEHTVCVTCDPFAFPSDLLECFTYSSVPARVEDQPDTGPSGDPTDQHPASPWFERNAP